MNICTLPYLCSMSCSYSEFSFPTLLSLLQVLSIPNSKKSQQELQICSKYNDIWSMLKIFCTIDILIFLKQTVHLQTAVAIPSKPHYPLIRPIKLISVLHIPQMSTHSHPTITDHAIAWSSEGSNYNTVQMIMIDNYIRIFTFNGPWDNLASASIKVWNIALSEKALPKSSAIWELWCGKVKQQLDR